MNGEASRLIGDYRRIAVENQGDPLWMVDKRIPVALVILKDEVVTSPFGIIDWMALMPGEKRLQAAHKVGAAADLAGCVGELVPLARAQGHSL
jgi:hypothetical protein